MIRSYVAPVAPAGTSLHAKITGRRSIIGLALLGAALTTPLSAQITAACLDPGNWTTYPWMNKTYTPSQRATLLLNASTLLQQERWLDEKAANNPTVNTGGVIGSGSTYPSPPPCTPYVNYADGPWGVSGPSGVTAWPVPIASAATWDTQAEFLKGQYTADEAWRKRDNGMLSPGVNLNRQPLWGRNSEMMGEDPILSGTLGAYMALGLQSVPGEAVMSDVKHWVGYEQEFNRNNMSTNVDARTLHELYALAFEITTKLLANQPGGSPSSVMCAYPMINEIWNCENNLMNTELKGEIGFPGYTMTDFFAIHSTANSLNAGLDQELNTPVYYSPTNLQAALTAGTITAGQIYAAALRVTTAYIATGLFDYPVPDIAQANTATPAHLALAQQIAQEGTVLLKNTGILPLRKIGQKIAIIGETASNVKTGNISADSVCEASGTAGTNPVLYCPVTQTAQGTSAYPFPVNIDPLTAITTRAAALGDTVVYDNGSNLTSAQAVAASADVVIVFGYNTEGEGTDLLNMTLDSCTTSCMSNGNELIQGVAAANPNTVVILETGNGAVLAPFVNQVAAIFEAWYPGVEQGNALAALLFGDVNPQGKLPVTFPMQVADLPTGTPNNAQYPGIVGANGGNSTAATSQVAYSEGLLMGYRWYDAQNITPLFPFGYGLSYTTYAYSGLSVVNTGSPTSNVAATFTVTNTGSMAGTEIAQVYMAMPTGLGEPPRKLVGWTRVTLNPGQSQTVTVNINPNGPSHPLSYWSNTASSWITPTGTFGVYVGSSSRTLPLLYKFKKL